MRKNSTQSTEEKRQKTGQPGAQVAPTGCSAAAVLKFLLILNKGPHSLLRYWVLTGRVGKQGLRLQPGPGTGAFSRPRPHGLEGILTLAHGFSRSHPNGRVLLRKMHAGKSTDGLSGGAYRPGPVHTRRGTSGSENKCGGVSTRLRAALASERRG